MKQLIGIIIFIFSLSFTLTSQTDSVYTGTKPPSKKLKKDHPEWQDKVTVGGNFQAFFGNPTFVYLSPSVGYLVLDNLNIGIGVIYNYTKTDQGIYGKHSHTTLGGHSYVRYNVTPSFFIQGQFDKLRQRDLFNQNDPNAKIWVDYAMAGVGYSQPVGSKVIFNTSIMYNFTYDSRYSIYPSPYVFQIGIVGRIR